MINNIQNKFSKNLKACLNSAKNQADENKLKIVPLNYFIFELFSVEGSLLSDIFKQKNLDQETLKKFFLKTENIADNELKINALVLSAFTLAEELNHYFVGTEHCLSILIEQPPKIITQFFSEFHINPQKLLNQLDALLRGNSKFPELTRQFKKTPATDFPDDELLTGDDGAIISYFSTDLTDEKVQSDINPVINRDQEINRMIQILCRKHKNNPVILGEPGVGKTALVEGLAKKILQGEVPNILLNKKILSLDLGSIIAGTMYRGDFENRLKQIINEVKSDPNTIIFIDEIHNIVGAGSSTGTMDAANLLKPILARGDIRCIGATTSDEYKKFIEKDAALERRFQPILLKEPTLIEAEQILHGIKDYYEEFHNVKFSDEAIKQAVHLSSRYIQDKLLPDKAIDLIDEAAAQKRIESSKHLLYSELKNAEKELATIKRHKKIAVREEQFNRALSLKQKENLVSDKLKQLQEKIDQEILLNPKEINEDDILAIISAKINIPLSQLKHGELSELKKLNSKLKKQIIGQDHAIEKIVHTILRSKLGFQSTSKPLASFLLLGPSGVGKTLTAKMLAEHLFHDAEAFIRIDMSEFAEKFNSSKLIGAPAGYVGYRESNKFTDLVRKRPYSLVLFDEIEKAHPDVINLLLQILEDGHISDAEGKKINFKNTIIVMTSNFGSEYFDKNIQIGFGSNNDDNLQNQILEEMKKSFRPEFINRIDQIILYNHLSKPAIEKIIKNKIKQTIPLIEATGLSFDLDQKQLTELVDLCLKQKNGARGADKIIHEYIEKPLIDKLLV